MRAAVQIATGLPSASKAAKKLGVSKKVARDLSFLAEHSVQTGEYFLPRVGRLVRVETKAYSFHDLSRVHSTVVLHGLRGSTCRLS